MLLSILYACASENYARLYHFESKAPSLLWEDIQDMDAIYISHIHQDHYDDRFFRFRKDIPILILDHKFNFLHKNLLEKGYTNLIKIKDGETKVILCQEEKTIF